MTKTVGRQMGEANPSARREMRTTSPAVRQLFETIDAGNVSYAEIARRVRMSRAVLTSYRHGYRSPRVDTLEDIAEVVGMKLVLVPR